jgi:hypothetical protein
MKPRVSNENKNQDSKHRTNVPGQNPKQDDSATRDVHHDESRRNKFDPEVAEGLKGSKRSKH